MKKMLSLILCLALVLSMGAIAHAHPVQINYWSVFTGADGAVLADHFADRAEVEKHACDWRPCYCRGVQPTGKEAFLVTEYGGIAFTNIGLQGDAGGMESWGYHEKVESEEAFFERFQSVTDAIRAIPYCQGYCYTQLTDVMQEINGLLTPDRKVKIDAKRFAALNRNPDAKTNQVS